MDPPPEDHPSQAWRKTPAKIGDMVSGALGFALVLAIGVGVLASLGWIANLLASFQPSWAMAFTAYIWIGIVAAILGGPATFVGLWIWASRRFGLAGFAIGWVPSGVAGVLAFYALVFAWLPLLAVAWIIFKLAD